MPMRESDEKHPAASRHIYDSLSDVVEHVSSSVSGDNPPSREELIATMIRLGAPSAHAERNADYWLGLPAAAEARSRGRPKHTPLAQYLRLNDMFRWYTTLVFEHRRLRRLKRRSPTAYRDAVKDERGRVRGSPLDFALRATAKKWNKSTHTILRGVKQLRREVGPSLPRFLTDEDWRHIAELLSQEDG